jgi:hypothetical protein
MNLTEGIQRVRFRNGFERAELMTTVDVELNGSDVDAVCAAIRQAKQTSDFAVFSLHTHEPGNYASRPPDFMRTLAHRAIEAGTDAVHGHGPHRLRGIEIHCGKPIFYSLGNFFFMENTSIRCRGRRTRRPVWTNPGRPPNSSSTSGSPGCSRRTAGTRASSRTASHVAADR